jgi:NADH:ubiquinone reductase (H+-translocating)
MKPFTCIVIGGGYAGIQAVTAIRKAWKDEAHNRKLRNVGC